MRTKLLELGNAERHLFYGTFSEYGWKKGWKGRWDETVLLLNIRDENDELLTDHLWFNLTQGFAKLDLKKGDRVCFYGRVHRYYKGYIAKERDYNISYPTKIKKVS